MNFFFPPLFVFFLSQLQRHPFDPKGLFDRNDDNNDGTDIRRKNPYNIHQNLTTTAYDEGASTVGALVLLFLLPFFGIFGCVGIICKNL